MRTAKRHFIKLGLATALAAAGLAGIHLPAAAQQKIDLLNVSYDPTRELYSQYNPLFAKHWKETTGGDITIRQSHGGSGKQARTVIDGVDADVVTLGLAPDVEALVTHGKLINEGWQKRLPLNSAPYTSTIVFVVKKGNPKGVKDWDDLTKTGVQVITPNPKTSAGARWNYLAAWEYGKRKFGGEAGAKDYITKVFANVPVLDSGARGSTITFSQRGVGDVLLAWENEAYLTLAEFGADKFEIVYPSLSILTEPTVAVVDKNVERKGTRAAAEAYLKFLYTEQAQELIAKNYYRPTDEKVKAKYASQFPKIELFTLDAAFGNWPNADKVHFADGGSFDQIYVKK
ncbi:sulfate ABC transporter substrate-binding protein [Pigmentiphaga aceris]|uniref:Sulfate ABC transporter substrate-binding protein n=1 Tax=Pigmentiphaga aceris TaxID=1940612 RepID=A0A5C0AV38_9BURK|nr:sulfate ABC transporter substrate-binding protein [Pigmentiphaga aceris]QEI05474.1 sulfate ABC transporter substrate-binding protein [Pigmentiphaga aceris]